jgi:hypothetical protein
MKHEICHAVMGPNEDGHSDKFIKLANVVGISKEYQD